MTLILERGDLFFFYRPRVGTDRVDDIDDVERFFFVLEPDKAKVFRRLIVGRKRLPGPSERERAWAFVAEVVKRTEELREVLERKVYETKTRGMRVQPEERAAGEARYAILEHEGHTHLAYALELPRRRGEVQKVLNPPDFLNYEGAEIVLIGAAEDAERELGIDFDTRRERLDTADLVRDLRLRIGKNVPAEPLKGRWA
jgi:hypothetical protein